MLRVDRSSVAEPARNQLLAKLPPEDLRRLRPYLRSVPLLPRQLLQKQGEPLQCVYFPNGGVVSMATVLADGSLVEAATIGDEGLVGIDAFFTEDALSACEAIVQVPVRDEDAMMMPVADFRRELATHRVFHDIVARYAQVLHAQITRLTACNARHAVNERCARWLLTAHDHMHGQDFHLSQEFLAVMLGVRRQAVSAVAGAFQEAGFIRYVHGHVTVLNRIGLEATTCECYAAIAWLNRRLNAQ